MRALLVPLGSRGDVQPMIGLGVELRRRGHEVVVGTGSNYRSLVVDAGLQFADGGADVQQVVAELGERAFSPSVFVRALKDVVPQSFTLLDEACAGADIVVGNVAAVAAPSIAEAHGIPFVWGVLQPSAFPTREHPFVLLGIRTLGAWLNSLSWTVAAAILDRVLRPVLNESRARRGLAAIASLQDHFASAGPALLAFDAEIATAPRDWDAARVHETGFWFYDDATALPPDLEDFLAGGEPPVYVGFGSMPIRAPEQMTQRVIDAVQAAGVRAVLSAGWAGLGGGDVPPEIKCIGPVSHALLFPRVRAIAHHCGAGTTAAACRAGVPQVPVPFGFDQPFWAHRVRAAGVGTEPLAKSFRSDGLALALRQCTDDVDLRRRAAALGARMQANPGVARAADRLESVVRR